MGRVRGNWSRGAGRDLIVIGNTLEDIRMKTILLLGLTVLLTLLNTTRGSFMGEKDLGERREAEAGKQLDVLVDYLIRRIQSEQEHPSYSRALERLIPKTRIEKRPGFNNNYADAVFRGLG